MTVDDKAEQVRSPGGSAVPEPVAGLQPAVLTQSRWLRRREDQLSVRFDCYNLALDASVAGKPVLRRVSALQPAYVVVAFSPQHLTERAFSEKASTGGLGSGETGSPSVTEATTWPVDTRLAGESRLAFAVPDGVQTIPFDGAAMLRWGTLVPSIAPVGLPRGAVVSGSPPAIRAPLPNETAIEAPWRLILSPHAMGRWAHAAGAVTHNGRTELWHTRLAVAGPDGGVDERDDDGRTVRAIWGTDPDFGAWLNGTKPPPDETQIGAAGLPFRMPLTPKDRVEIVRATSDFAIPGYTPDPVDAERIALSSFGTWLDVRGAWNPPPAVLSIADWQHRSTGGRDQDVRVVRRGYLLPFGHPAAVVAVSERRLAPTPTGAQAAYLRQRFVLVVRGRTKRYTAFGQDAGGRRFPFRRLTITATTTPTLDARAPFLKKYGGAAFVPTVDGVPFEFHLVGQDRAGRRCDFTAPAVFVETTLAFDEPTMTDIRTEYNARPATDPLRRRPFAGQHIAIADSAKPHDTDVEAASLTFAVEAPVVGQPDAAFIANDQPRCHPAMTAASVRLADAERLSGGQLGPVDISYDATYAAAGFDPGKNKGEVFAALASEVGLGFGPDRAGPITPGFAITGLSRTLGPVGGDLATLKNGTYDTPSILASAPKSPQILGGVKLSDVVRPVALTAGSAPDGAMTLGTRTAGGGQQALAADPNVEQHFTFRPPLVDDPLGLLHFFDYTFAQVDVSMRLDSTDQGSYTEHIKFQALISNAKPWSLIQDLPENSSGPPALTDKPAFTLRLFGDLLPVVKVEVIKLVFRAETGKEPEVVPVIGAVHFGGVLRFVEQMQDALKEVMGPPSPKGSPSLGPIIKPQGDMIEVGISVGVPAFALGVFTLKNIALGFSVVMPFLAVADVGQKRPLRFNFYFAQRENPFLLSVYCFGGGGFFGMGCGADGMEWFEIALEFGAHVEMDFKVASGAIEIMAGIYFRLTALPSGEKDCTLTGYVRLRGHVAVRGIISICLEAYLGLTYESLPNQVVGQATLTIEVTLLIFSISVSVHVERRFSGKQQDPSFLDLVPSQDVWDDYAEAFAAVEG